MAHIRKRNMIKNTSVLIAVACAAAVAGCSAQLDEARRAAPAGSTFDRALQSGYLQLARAELDELDLVDTDEFAGRALKLAHGERVDPERLDARKLPTSAVTDLAGARARLIAAFDRGAREREPKQAAEAQLRFDCWMQEQEENFQPHDIAACRGGFLVAVEKIETAAPALARTRAPALRATPAAARVTKIVRKPKSVMVMFSFDSAKIDGPAKIAIAKALTAFKEFGTAVVRVAGHADRAGPEAYNMKLGRARADAVAQQIRRAGIPTNLIRVLSFGESRPAVPTKDGLREDKNRRVEIGIDPRLPRTAIRQ